VRVAFRIAQKTLASLEWHEILARLAGRTRTARARERLRAGPPAAGAPQAGEAQPAGTPAGLFEPDAAGVRERLAETREALGILEESGPPPLGGAPELAPALARARKGGVLGGEELVAVAAALEAIEAVRRFLAARAEAAPRLADLAGTLAPHAALRAELALCLDPSGELRDEASAVLAGARREARRLAAEIQARLARTLQDPAVRACLSDAYFTVRGDRYVLPVRADAAGGVRGIVHDASRSGTTLFVEPEALVELNNRHKQAELAVEQETLRVLRGLSEAVAATAGEIDAGLDTLAALDLAFARAELARELRAVEPEVRDEGVLCLPQLRHPLLAAGEAVGNDLRLGEGFTVLVLSGPNAGGKTVAMKSLALAVLFTRAGFFVPAEAPARVDLFDAVLCDIGDEQDIREHLSTFSAHMANLAEIVGAADAHSLVALDEVGAGTDPGEGAALAQAVLEKLADAGARVVATTHFNLLKEMAEVDERFANASVEFDPQTLAPTFRLRMGLPGTSSASAVAARMGLRRDVLERAEEILAREDRRLDHMLRELGASRAALEREKQQAERVRAEGETARARYGEKLAALAARRDELYRAMRHDLDRAFRDAHAQIARVVAEVQRGGTSQEAARARESLLEVAERARAAEAQAGLEPAPAAPPHPLDWKRARPGDPVALDGRGAALLVALPDRRGRVTLSLGSARLVVPMERVGALAPGAAAPARPSPRPAPLPEPPAADGGRCDLRGLRVDEALDRLDESLDRALAAGRAEVVVVHGIGTGALRRAVREHLARSACVTHFLPGAPEAGGEGVTTAYLG
jgi:DNA mismatch repair protein MutS2